MKRYEALKLVGGTLKMLSVFEINYDDWRFVSLYEEFREMRDKGMKYREAVRMLAEDYHISRASVERAIKRLESDC
jgi:DNA-binding MarR family transcriptional regulator